MRGVISVIILAFLFAQCNTNKTLVDDTETVILENGQAHAKNIILLIGDGMGLSQITGGMYTQHNYTALENYPIVGLQKTHSFDNLITDSAASGTAIATGHKTNNYAIAVDSDGNAVKTILEEAEERKLCTGIVATSTIVHATPASFIAHNVSRYNYEEIAADFLETEIDFFVGGGKRYFDRRIDERNLLSELEPTYYVSHFNKEELTDITPCLLYTSDAADD